MGRGFQTENVTFDIDKGELALGFALVATPAAMGEALAATVSRHARPGDLRTLPHWAIIVVDLLPLESNTPVRRQMVLPPDLAAAMLGQLQGWHAKIDRVLQDGPQADQLDALRAEAAASWAQQNWRD